MGVAAIPGLSRVILKGHTVTSPYSSALLNDAPDHATIPAPRRQVVRPSESVAAPSPQYYPQPYAPQMAMQGYQPQPIYIQRSGGSKFSSLMMGIAILLLAALAAVAGFAMSRNAAPTVDEMNRYQDIAAYGGYQKGRDAGMVDGRQYAIESNRQITHLKAMIARQKAWNAGYRNGKRTGLSTGQRRTNYTGGYGYRAPRQYYGGGRTAQVNSALASAQSLANATGAPVDVEIY